LVNDDRSYCTTTYFDATKSKPFNGLRKISESFKIFTSAYLTKFQPDEFIRRLWRPDQNRSNSLTHIEDGAHVDFDYNVSGKCFVKRR